MGRRSAAVNDAKTSRACSCFAPVGARSHTGKQRVWRAHGARYNHKSICRRRLARTPFYIDRGLSPQPTFFFICETRTALAFKSLPQRACLLLAANDSLLLHRLCTVSSPPSSAAGCLTNSRIALFVPKEMPNRLAKRPTTDPSTAKSAARLSARFRSCLDFDHAPRII